MDISRFNSLVGEFPFLLDVIRLSQGTGGWNDHRAVVGFEVAHMDRDMLARAPYFTHCGESSSLLELFVVRDGKASPINCVTERLDSSEYDDGSFTLIDMWDEYMTYDNPPPGDDPVLLQIYQDTQRIVEDCEKLEAVRAHHFQWRVPRALKGDENYVIRVECQTWTEEIPNPEDEYFPDVEDVFSNHVTVYKLPKYGTLLDLIKSTIETEGVPTATDVDIRRIEIVAGLSDVASRLEDGL